MFDLIDNYTSSVETITMMLTVISALIHIIFAGAVAKDAGLQLKLGHKSALVSGVTWAFATLVGGVFVAAVYWFMHHSKITRG